MSKILVADPQIRLDCEGMLNHPWMQLDLSANKKLSVAKSALSKYVSVRKDKSQKFKIDDDEGDF